MELLLAIPIIWIAIGIWLVIKTKSRGWRADLQFVFEWPIHWFLEKVLGR